MALNKTDVTTIKEVLSRKRKNADQLKTDEKVAKLSIFDIEHEEIQNKRAVDDIALNGAKLIREQLTISEESKLIDF